MPDWWGGKRGGTTPGDKPPIDLLDKIAMEHDYGYWTAEMQGKLYGTHEEHRLKGIADAIAVEAAKALTADPSKWKPPPRYIDLARKNREVMIKTFTVESSIYDAMHQGRVTFDEYVDKYINSHEESLTREALLKLYTKQYFPKKFLKQNVQNRISGWYRKHGIKKILPKVYDSKSIPVGNVPDTDHLEREQKELSIKPNDISDYVQLRKFGANKDEAKKIIDLLKKKFLGTEKKKALDIIRDIEYRNKKLMHNNVSVRIVGQSEVLPGHVLRLHAKVVSKTDPIEYIYYKWSENVMAEERLAFFREYEPGEYDINVSILYGGEVVAQSNIYKITVIDNHNPEIDMKIIGPNRINKGEDITLWVKQKSHNKSGKLMMKSGETYLEWVLDGTVVERGDTMRPFFGNEGTYRIVARLIYEHNGIRKVIAKDSKEIIVQTEATMKRKQPNEQKNTRTRDVNPTIPSVGTERDRPTQKQDKGENRKNVPMEVPTDNTPEKTEEKTPKVDIMPTKNDVIPERLKSFPKAIEQAYKNADCKTLRQISAKLSKMQPYPSELLIKIRDYTLKLADQKWIWFKKDVLSYIHKIIAKVSGQNPSNRNPEGSLSIEEEICKKKVKKISRFYRSAKNEHKTVERNIFDAQGDYYKQCDIVAGFLKKYDISESLIIPDKYKNICQQNVDIPKEKNLSVSISGSHLVKIKQSVTLQAEVSGGANPVDIKWSGDNISPQGSRAIFVATVPGSYLVQVTAKDANEKYITASHSIKVKERTQLTLSGLGGEIYYGKTYPLSVIVPTKQSTQTQTNTKKPCTKASHPFDDCIKIIEHSVNTPPTSGASVRIMSAVDEDVGGPAMPVRSVVEQKASKYEFIWQPSGSELVFEEI